MNNPPLHPVQNQGLAKARHQQATLPQTVTMMAYEVYCHVHGEQPAMVTGGCRGGFSVGEVIAFLYARNFPKDQWRDRCDEAFTGMNL